jgi:hypothetical protein
MGWFDYAQAFMPSLSGGDQSPQTWQQYGRQGLLKRILQTGKPEINQEAAPVSPPFDLNDVLPDGETSRPRPFRPLEGTGMLARPEPQTQRPGYPMDDADIKQYFEPAPGVSPIRRPRPALPSQPGVDVPQPKLGNALPPPAQPRTTDPYEAAKLDYVLQHSNRGWKEILKDAFYGAGQGVGGAGQGMSGRGTAGAAAGGALRGVLERLFAPDMAAERNFDRGPGQRVLFEIERKRREQQYQQGQADAALKRQRDSLMPSQGGLYNVQSGKIAPGTEPVRALPRTPVPPKKTALYVDDNGNFEVVDLNDPLATALIQEKRLKPYKEPVTTRPATPAELRRQADDLYPDDEADLIGKQSYDNFWKAEVLKALPDWAQKAIAAGPTDAYYKEAEDLRKEREVEKLKEQQANARRIQREKRAEFQRQAAPGSTKKPPANPGTGKRNVKDSKYGDVDLTP